MALTKIHTPIILGIKQYSPLLLIQSEKIHNSSSNLAWHNIPKVPTKFLKHNEKIYPPQSPDEEPRPAVSSSTINKNFEF